MKKLWFAALPCIILLGCTQVEEFKGPIEGSREILIYGTTDRQVFAPAVADFKDKFPNVEVRYVELEAAPLYNRFLAEQVAGTGSADLLLSAAMDLQVKLVNDGYATPHHSDNARDVPRWAKWRDEAFGVTFEPVVMIFNADLMKGRAVPHSRAELLQALRQDQEFWLGRIGTYDIAESGVGYMLAAQDAGSGGDFGALIEAFRDAGMVTYETTSAIIDDIESGKLVAGYNVLGSYASIRQERSSKLKVVFPKDYTLAVSRTALIPKGAKNEDVAHVFLEYILSRRGQRVLTEESRLNAVRVEIADRVGDLVRSESRGGQLRPIALGPGLLVYLDQQKRERLLSLWGTNAKAEDPIQSP